MLPNFFKKIDRYLLLNKPEVWSTKIHFAIFFFLILFATVVFLCFLVLFDLRTDENVSQFILFLSILSFIFFIVWLVFLLRFNPFKQFAKLSRWYALSTYLTYFFIISLIISLPYIPSFYSTLKANIFYSNTTIKKDIDQVNKYYATINFKTLNAKWKTKLLYIDEKNNIEVDSLINALNINDTTNNIYVNHQQFDDRDELQMYLASNKDSIQKITEEVYVEKTLPDFKFYTGYSIYDKKFNFLSNEEIFEFAKNAQGKQVEKNLYKNAEQLILKYTNPDYFIQNRKNEELFLENMFSAFNSGVENIIHKKIFLQNSDIDIYFYSFFYICITLASLTFIFRHSTKKSFFLSLLIGFLTFLFISMSSMAAQNSNLFYGLCLFSTFIYFLISSITNNEKHRMTLTGIALNITFFICPLILLNIFGLFFNNLKKDDSFFDWFEFAAFGGFAFFLVLIPLYFFPQYKKWYAKPDL